jgi:hypothetical protein
MRAMKINNLDKSFILSLIWKIESAILMLAIVLFSSTSNFRLSFWEIAVLSLLVVFSHQILGFIWKSYLFLLQAILSKVLGLFGGKLLDHFLVIGITEFVDFHNTVWLKVIRI